MDRKAQLVERGDSDSDSDSDSGKQKLIRGSVCKQTVNAIPPVARLLLAAAKAHAVFAVFLVDFRRFQRNCIQRKQTRIVLCDDQLADSTGF